MPYKLIYLPGGQENNAQPPQQDNQQPIAQAPTITPQAVTPQSTPGQQQGQEFPLYTTLNNDKPKYRLISYPEGYVRPEDEGMGTKIARTVAGSIAQLGTGLASEPGNIQNTAQAAQGLIGGSEETPGLKFPTSNETNKWLHETTGNLLKPRGHIEETIQNIAHDIGGYLPWLFIAPVGGALKGLKSALSIATKSNIASQTVKAMGGDEGLQAAAKIGTGVLSGLRGTRKAAQKLHDVSYAKTEANLPSQAVHTVSDVESKLSNIEKSASVGDKKFVRDRVKEFKNLVVETPKINEGNLSTLKNSVARKIKTKNFSPEAHQQANELISDIDSILNNENLSLKDLSSVKDKISKKISSGDLYAGIAPEANQVLKQLKTVKQINVMDTWKYKKGLTGELYAGNVPETARKQIGDLIGLTHSEVLQPYGKLNTAFGHNLNVAEDLHKGLKEASAITKFFVKHTNLENLVKKSPILKMVLGLGAFHYGLNPSLIAAGAAGATTMVSARELSRFKDLLSSSKEARKLFQTILAGAAKNNLAVVTSAIQNLDNIASSIYR